MFNFHFFFVWPGFLQGTKAELAKCPVSVHDAENRLGNMPSPMLDDTLLVHVLQYCSCLAAHKEVSVVCDIIQDLGGAAYWRPGHAQVERRRRLWYPSSRLLGRPQASPRRLRRVSQHEAGGFKLLMVEPWIHSGTHAPPYRFGHTAAPRESLPPARPPPTPTLRPPQHSGPS